MYGGSLMSLSGSVASGAGSNCEVLTLMSRVKRCSLCVQILIPFENRTSENMYNRYTISRLQRLVPQVSLLRRGYGVEIHLLHQNKV